MVTTACWTILSSSAAMHPAVQIDQLTLQPGLILLPRDAIDSRGGFPLQGVKALP
jgi:hypothetical protein